MTTARASATSGVQIGVIVLAAATALIHLYLGLQGFPIFILNGLGYLGLLGALYLPIPQLARYHNAARWVLIGYTALTIFLWILIGARTPIGYIDKLIEVALIALLVLDARRQS